MRGRGKGGEEERNAHGVRTERQALHPGCCRKAEPTHGKRLKVCPPAGWAARRARACLV